MRRLTVTALVVAALAGGTGCGAEEAARETVDPVAEAAERTAAAGGARFDGEYVYTIDGERITSTLTGWSTSPTSARAR